MEQSCIMAQSKKSDSPEKFAVKKITKKAILFS